MKTPSLCGASLRAFLFVLASLPAASPPTRAEWIALQIPLSLSSNNFSLWELVPAATAGSTPFAGGDHSGLEIGSYLQSSVTPVQFIGGSFDASGNWVPDANSYFMVSVARKGAGSFWLLDSTTGRFSPPNQTSLINAQWHEPNPTVPMRYFALPESRFGHVFSLQYWDANYTTYLLSTGDLRGEFLVDGSFSSYGFFEGWGVELLPPSTPPTLPYEAWLIDHTESLALYVDASGHPSDPFVSASWQPFTGATPTYPVTFVLGTDHGPASFTLHMVNGNQQAMSAEWDPTDYVWKVSASVGRGREFWLEREDGRMTSHDWMIDSALVEDVQSVFPNPAPDVQTLMFRVRTDTYNPAALSVEQPGRAAAPLSAFDYATLESWDDLGNYSSLSYATCTAEVDLKRAWTVRKNSTENLGQGPDFFDGWQPAHSAAPAGTQQFWIPSIRRNDTIHIEQTGGNWNLSAQGNTGSISETDPWTGAVVSWDYFIASAPVASLTASATLVDENYAESLPLTSATDILAPIKWFPKTTLQLKISATRWGHDLRVRSILGEFPVTPHQIQGDWSLDPVSGNAHFNAYGYFDATAPAALRATGTAAPLVLWTLVDKTRLNAQNQPEVLSTDPGEPMSFVNATDNTDTDGDGLKDWYERVIGTNPNLIGGWDTDLDGYSDGYEVAHGTDPRSLSPTAPGSTLKVYTQLR